MRDQNIYHPNTYNPRKRQRKQAAGALFVDPFLSAGKKSTAQPRPAVYVQPLGIGPIVQPNKNDVLCGRGGRINAHDGNVQFREIIVKHKKEYLSKATKKLDKAHIAARIIQEIRTLHPPGRFLKEDSSTGMWWDIGDQKAIKKAGQALREDAPDLRNENDGGAEQTAEKKNSMSISPTKKTPKPRKVIAPKPSAKQRTLVNNPPPQSTAIREGRGAMSGHNPQVRIPMSGRGAQQNMRPQQERSQQNMRPQQQQNNMRAQQNMRQQRQQLNNNKKPHPSTRQKSWDSSGSSSFGISLHEPPARPLPASNPSFGFAAKGFAAKGFAAKGFAAKGLLQNAAALVGSSRLGLAFNRHPRGTEAGNMSKQAFQRMHPQQQVAQGPPRRPDEVLFGRGFTPTEINSTEISGVSGNTMSSLSNFSGLTESTCSNRVGSSYAVAPTSSQFPPPIHPMAARLLLGPVPTHHHNFNSRNQISDLTLSNGKITPLTRSYMSTSGLQRSPSFEDLTGSGAPLGYPSFAKMLAAEDKQVADVFDSMPPPLKINCASPSSSNSRRKAAAQTMSNLMSVASISSSNSAMSESSWLGNNSGRISNVKGGGSMASSFIGGSSMASSYRGGSLGSFGGSASIGSLNSGMGTMTHSLLGSVKSMSDVSENIMALDLASTGT